MSSPINKTKVLIKPNLKVSRNDEFLKNEEISFSIEEIEGIDKARKSFSSGYYIKSADLKKKISKRIK
jgi:hypothetical protein